MPDEQTTELRPFHETVVDAIERAKDPPQLYLLANLIKKTKIPKNHDAIITAWQEAREFLRLTDSDLGVPGALLVQKEAAEAEEDEEESEDE